MLATSHVEPRRSDKRGRLPDGDLMASSLPIPPEAIEAMNYFRAAGIPLRSLLLKARPPQGCIQGGYDCETGDLWCYDQESTRDLMHCLLSLIARAKLGLSSPTSIEEDWQQMRLVHREAYGLAQAWKPEYFDANALGVSLQNDEMLERRHRQVAGLVGSPNPALARRAYQELDYERRQRGWDESHFEAVLAGTSAGGRDDRMVLGFDRTCLRERWLSTAHPLRQQELLSSFDHLGLPVLPTALRILRKALRDLAQQEDTVPVSIYERSYQEQLAHLVCVQIENEDEIRQAIATANSWLLSVPGDWYVKACWWCYGDLRSSLRACSPHQPLGRLYRLEISYARMPTQPPIQRCELWCLFPARAGESTLEAAWQWYIQSWRAKQAIAPADMFSGLQTLFAWLGA